MTSAIRRSVPQWPNRRATRCRAATERRDVHPRHGADAVPTRPTSSRYTRSMPTLRDAISAVSPPISTRSSPRLQKQLAPGNTIQVTGQIESMNRAFRNMAHRATIRGGVRLSADGRELPEFWRPVCRDPGLPATLLRHCDHALHHGHDIERSLSDGRIMAVGVASANSILLVTFAREQQLAGTKALRCRYCRPGAPEFARC